MGMMQQVLCGLYMCDTGWYVPYMAMGTTHLPLAVLPGVLQCRASCTRCIPSTTQGVAASL